MSISVDSSVLQAAPRRSSRANDAEDKQRRRSDILDAVDRLQLARTERDTSMAAVARAAGLAKGTVYLYFDSKEAMLVAAYARKLDAFFDELIAAVDQAGAFGIDELAALARRHLTESPAYMVLAGQCMAFLGKPAAASEAAALSARIAQRLSQAGAGIERRHPGLLPGEGTRLLIHGYALIVGLWHLIGAPITDHGPVRQLLPARLYADEAELALRRYWHQLVPAAPARPRAACDGQSMIGHCE